MFTETVDEKTAALARRIVGKHDRFCTDFIGVRDAGDTGAIAVRLVARRDDDGWGITRITYAPGLGTMKQKTEARSGLCFFDALAYCARFQAAELAGHEGRCIIDPPEDDIWASCVSYRQAGEDAGQGFDHEGHAVPCADGRILIDGSFSVETMTRALRTKKEDLTPVATGKNLILPGFDGGALLTVNRSAEPVTGAVARYETRLADSRRKQAEQAVLHRMLFLGQRLQNTVADMTRDRFKKPSLLAGLFHFYGAKDLAHRRWSVTDQGNKAFFSLKESFGQAVASMADGPAKSAALDFAKAAESALWLERAAVLLSEDRSADKGAGRDLDRALRHIHQAGEVAGMTGVDIERLTSRCLEDDFIPGDNAGKLARAWARYSIGLQYSSHDMDPETEIGQAIPDGAIFGGLSPTTGTLLFFTPRDELDLLNWPTAFHNARALRNFHGHAGSQITSGKDILKKLLAENYDHGWRLPTMDELTVLAENKNTGAFTRSFSEKDADHWSCEKFEAKNITSGSDRHYPSKRITCAVRYART